MIGIAGIACVFVMVFGGYLMAGGKIEIILKSLPYELTMIGGAAVGAFLLSNALPEIKKVLRDLGRVFRGTRWTSGDYRDLLCLLHELIRVAKQSPVELEAHIDQPGESALFKAYPRILADGTAVSLICDTLRAMSMDYNDPHQVEELLEKRLEEIAEHDLHSSHALQTMADGLPALGIVAAVLGVIKTMSSIDQPPEVLGKLIGGALVGTFLGVFLAYGIVGPMATRLAAIAKEDAHFYRLVKEVIVACLHNHAAGMCVEVGRQAVPAGVRPDYTELEDALRSLRAT